MSSSSATPKPNVVVPRQVWVEVEDSEQKREKVKQPLSDFRDQAAWVLLGEPGSGKSTSFREEAEATGGVALHIDDFLDLGPDPRWSGKTLFLDGLDEVRARSGDSILHDLRRKLKEQGYPPFRIACRAGDWSASTDEMDLARVSPGGKLQTLILNPLSHEEACQILRENHGVADPNGFIETVKGHGLQDLLDNPQNLEMLVKAHREGIAPRTREETYRLACEMLAQEFNPRHQRVNSQDPCPTEEILQAAGHLCAVILLANQRGIALTEDGRNRHFPMLETFSTSDPKIARRALDTRLFRNEGADALAPSHRTIAEYLGAEWLADLIDGCQLPLGRVLNLLVGLDGRSVHGLRGLYAWLATLCLDAQRRLIQADPMTVLTYGDPKILAAPQKRIILAALRNEAEQNPGFNWNVRADHVFGVLSCVELIPDFLAILECPDRGDTHEIYVRCSLDALEHGTELPDLVPALWALVEDSTHWQTNRRDALRLWWKLGGQPELALELLAKVQDGRVEDDDDEFLGILLGLLYPAHLSAKALLDCIHLPKRTSLFGAYRWFVGHELAKMIESSQIPGVLDSLAARLGATRCDIEDRSFFRFIDSLVLRGLQEHGESASGEQLCRWLGIGNDIYGNSDQGADTYKSVSTWLGEHPVHYKRVLDEIFKQKRDLEGEPHLYRDWQELLRRAIVPKDLGQWHLNSIANEPEEKVARLHLHEAAQAIWEGVGDEGLTLDDLFSWAETRHERKAWLEPLLSWEIQSWRQERKNREQKHEAEERQRRLECRQNIQPELAAIRDGSASTRLLNQLARVWEGQFTNTQGPTPVERFQGYCEPWEEILEASEAGFPQCLHRSDIPSAEEIIELNFKNKEYHLQYPSLVGMGLLWGRDPEACMQLPKETLRSLVAFWIHCGAGDHPQWFQTLCAEDSQLVADIYVAYTQASWLNRAEHALGLHWLLSSESCLQPVAKVAIPSLLGSFPQKATPAQVRNLESLLKAALLMAPETLAHVTQGKVACREMDPAQMVLWLLVGTLIGEKELSDLWEGIGTQLDYLDLVADFAAWMANRECVEGKPSPGLIGGLVQRLEPHASTSDLRSGHVSREDNRRDLIRGFVNSLETLTDPNTEAEIERLLGLGNLQHISFHLKQVRAHRRTLQREAEFCFFEPGKVAQVLANAEPASIDDLTQLTLDHLDVIANELRTANDDGVIAFWNVPPRKKPSQREENRCRDHLMLRLRSRLLALHIECAPEFDYANDKRADIRVSYRTDFALPIEIKRDSHRELWTALRTQLIPQYTTDHLAQGRGLYLVLWFGGKGMQKDPSDNQKPTSALNLQARLECQILKEEAHRVFVRVIDVSLPGSTGVAAQGE